MPCERLFLAHPSADSVFLWRCLDFPRCRLKFQSMFRLSAQKENDGEQRFGLFQSAEISPQCAKQWNLMEWVHQENVERIGF